MAALFGLCYDLHHHDSEAPVNHKYGGLRLFGELACPGGALACPGVQLEK